MNSNKIFLLLAATALTGAVVAASAFAEPSPPPADPYFKLSAVDMNDGQTPQLNGGYSSLGGDERKFREPLAIQKPKVVKKASAKGHASAHGKPSAHAKKVKASKHGKASKKAQKRKTAKPLPSKSF